ncbi:MAG: DNA-directed RNA polymerase subunit N [Candidatus Aenigmarchaeota archaeon]|nr:DNA-directed RNA polymerase subunit N [Candidatus Aenigmarchaeota archaeon]
MFIPIRCKSCGRVVAHKWEEFNKRKNEGEDVKKILDSLGISSYCCRALFLSHVDTIKEIMKFKR